MSNIDKRALREAAEKATESDWIVDAHEGWHAVIPVADAVNGNYIIAEFQGPESKRNRDFVAAANPVTVLSLLDELDAKNRSWAAQDDHINQQADRIESLEKKNGDLGRALGAAEKRIAELVALANGVKQFSEFQICHYGASEDYAKGYIDCQNNYNKILFAAGTAKGE
ncbi:ead/Ea22-like family protein [Enterobacter soli]|uniref:ead/Ea22-like family protein n=1 Tax=Enterobacter soli TaxID=885040 RepID=UPI00289933A8|nr:ead/Ea22-like family protein [Enterobacter soli]